MNVKRKKVVAETQATESQPVRAQTLGGVVPYLQVNGASAASEFYQRAFGAVEVYRNPVDETGRTMHIHLHLNGGSLMLSDRLSRARLCAERAPGLQPDAAGGRH